MLGREARVLGREALMRGREVASGSKLLHIGGLGPMLVTFFHSCGAVRESLNSASIGLGPYTGTVILLF